MYYFKRPIAYLAALNAVLFFLLATRHWFYAIPEEFQGLSMGPPIGEMVDISIAYQDSFLLLAIAVFAALILVLQSIYKRPLKALWVLLLGGYAYGLYFLNSFPFPYSFLQWYQMPTNLLFLSAPFIAWLAYMLFKSHE